MAGASPVSDKLDKMSYVKDERITVRLSADLRQRLRHAARRRGARESDLIREAVERELAAEPNEITAYEALKKAGLIGIVKGAPPDLATNPKYFDGFGRS
jgi:predicted transcriptional regulator